ncbi:hypothetical protein NSP_28890 [Nodularia spumigena CCY9414]|nr:hypothetical protein NSP_28890 [Nodularia spumigena CCY9414]
MQRFLLILPFFLPPYPYFLTPKPFIYLAFGFIQQALITKNSGKLNWIFNLTFCQGKRFFNNNLNCD